MKQWIDGKQNKKKQSYTFAEWKIVANDLNLLLPLSLSFILSFFLLSQRSTSYECMPSHSMKRYGWKVRNNQCHTDFSFTMFLLAISTKSALSLSEISQLYTKRGHRTQLRVWECVHSSTTIYMNAWNAN